MPDSPPTAPHLWTVLAKCHRAVSMHVAQSVEKSGLCLSDFAVLEALLHKGPLTISAIGAKVLLASGSMTAAVDRLEKKGLVQREATSQDRRARMIHLTEQGKTFIVPVFQKHKKDLETVMACLNDRETELLCALLKKLGLFAAQAPRKEKGSTKQ